MPQSRTRKGADAHSATELESIPNIGPSLAQDLRRIGIKRPHQLIGCDPELLYKALCELTRARQDPCVLDTFISAIRFMEGAPARPWWHYTAERKRSYDALSSGAWKSGG
jgi:pathogenicity locus Cdd1 protein